jgi:hypothetical protein
MKKKALVYGFIGRENFGDELMLQLHMRMLEKLGYDVFCTTDFQWLEKINDQYFFYNKIIKNPRVPKFDLIIYGGGAIPLYYGIDILFEQKVRNPSVKIIGSSINLFNSCNIQDTIFSMYNNLFDGLIFRQKITDKFVQQLKTPHIFLPDIATTIRYTPPTKKDACGVIIRKYDDINIDSIFLPEGDMDILVMSRDDMHVVDHTPLLAGINTRIIYGMSPIEQYKILMSYKRILSMGRFHAAICGKSHKDNTCYLNPFSNRSYQIESPGGVYSWEDLKKFEYLQSVKDSERNFLAKTGETTDKFYEYPSAKIEQYTTFIESIIS